MAGLIQKSKIMYSAIINQTACCPLPAAR